MWVIVLSWQDFCFVLCSIWLKSVKEVCKIGKTSLSNVCVCTLGLMLKREALCPFDFVRSVDTVCHMWVSMCVCPSLMVKTFF